MVSSATAVLWASLNGSIELVALCAAGAFLAYRNILVGPAVASLSQSMVNLFIPTLMYCSMLEGLQIARNNFSFSRFVEIVFPPIWGILVLIIGLLVAIPCTKLLARGKEEAVRRTVLVCIMVGNGRSMPLLILTALCENYGPFREDPRCVSRAAELTSLFSVTWNCTVWLLIFAYLLNAPDVDPDEEDGLLPKRPTVHVPKPGLFSPMSLSVVFALITVLIPHFTDALLSPGGALSPVFSAFQLVGNMAVPTGLLVVGARLYSSQVKDKGESGGGLYTPERKKFGFRAHLGIVVIRMIIMPFIGRVIYRVFNMWAIPGKMLGVFSLTVLATPTANNIVMMITILAQCMPNLGPQLEEDVATSVFYQFLLIPIFFTINSALSLNIVFNEHP